MAGEQNVSTSRAQNLSRLFSDEYNNIYMHVLIKHVLHKFANEHSDPLLVGGVCFEDSLKGLRFCVCL